MDGFFHDATGILSWTLLQYPRTALYAAYHDHYQHQQKQQDYHPRQVLIDVKVLVRARPRRTPADRPVTQTLGLALRQSFHSLLVVKLWVS